MFCNLLDIAAYNAFVLFLSANPKYGNYSSHKRRLFLIELAKSLIGADTATVEIGPDTSNNLLQFPF